MRDLTTSAQALSVSQNASPALLLDLDCGAGGLHRYADRDLSGISASGRIVKAEPLLEVLFAAGGASSSDIEFVLEDIDGAIKDLFEAGYFENAEASVYRHFDPLGESDLVPVFGGEVRQAVFENGVAKISISAASRFVDDRVLGRRASRSEFPKLGEGEEGKMLPLVFGRPRRVKAVLVEGGGVTELARMARLDDEEIIVRDASRFPSGEIRIRVGQEEMTGSFDGNTFTVTERGAVLESGQVSETSGRPKIIRASTLTSDVDNAYTGLYLKMTVDGREQYRLIVQYVADGKTLVLAQPFYVGTANYLVPAGSEYEICSIAQKHKPGEVVREVLDEYVYMISDAPVEKVEAVEGWGVTEPAVKVGSEKIVSESRGYVTLPPTSYRVVSEDNGLTGHATATVRLPKLPSDIAEGKFVRDELYVSLRGYPEDGSAVENPADIIHTLLTDFAGLDPSLIDAASFATAASARDGDELAFSLDRPRPLGQVLHDLAFQSRCALLWENGKAVLRALSNAVGASVLTLDSDNVESGLLKISETGYDDTASGVTAVFTSNGEKQAVSVIDENARDRFGDRVRAVSFWAIQKRHLALATAEWWLRRWRHRYRTASVTTFLPALPVTRDDTVTLNLPGLSPVPISGRVGRIGHAPGDYVEGEIDRIGLTVRLPVWGGCSSSCEHVCETSACETSGCELSCTSTAETSCAWTCETSCEEACELSCTASCELSCQQTCMLSCRAGGEATPSCASTCESGCEVDCEGWACETSCEVCCEVNCESTATETPGPVRQVVVQAAPAAQFGQATVLECDRDGNSRCDAFTAWDSFDLRPAAGDVMAIMLNFFGDWILVPGPRNVKFVKIESDLGSGQYTVVEQDRSGNAWGTSFTAWEIG